MCCQALRSLSQAWANPSAVKHTPLEQQLYVSKALLLSVNLLDDSELRQLKSGTAQSNSNKNSDVPPLTTLCLFFIELLQCMLGGMHSHLDSSVERIRQIGMVVGECLSSRMNIEGTSLKFEVLLMCSLLPFAMLKLPQCCRSYFDL